MTAIAGSANGRCMHNHFLELTECAATASNILPLWWSTEVRERMTLLGDALLRSRQLSLLGRYLANVELHRAVENHWAIASSRDTGGSLAGQPQVSERVKLVVAGRPRSATTFLHQNLAALDGVSSIRGYQATGAAAVLAGQTERAIAAAISRSGLIWRAAPELARMHQPNVMEAEECTTLLMSFPVLFQWCLEFPIPPLFELMCDEGSDSGYEFLSAALGQLLSESIGPIVLKSPGHCGHYEEILKEFPEAGIVEIQRPRAEWFGSWIALTKCAASLTIDGSELSDREKFWEAYWRQAVEYSRSFNCENASLVTSLDFRDVVNDVAETLVKVASKFTLIR